MNWIAASDWTAADGAPPLGYIAPLAGGEAGTAQTVELMRQLIDQALRDPTFIRQAVDIVRGVPQYDDLAEAQRVFSWVVSNIRYTKHPVGKQVLYPPLELLQIRASDCPNISMLTAALMIALGYPARLVTVRADASAPEDFSHVYVEAEVPAGSGQWVAMDAARPGAQFGVAPALYFGPKRAWSLTDSSFEDLSGFGYSRTRMPNGAGAPLLGAYGRVRSLGDDPNVTAQDIAATGQAVSNIIAAGRGSPYASFATPYTPGAAPFYPTAGYGLQTPVVGGMSGLTWLLLIGGGLLLLGRH